MELKQKQEELDRLKLKEELLTLEYIKKITPIHRTVLNLSNHYIFHKSATALSALLSAHFTQRNTLKSLILSNCCLDEETLTIILTGLIRVDKAIALRYLDISSNRITISMSLGSLLNQVFKKSGSNKAKTIHMKGNSLMSELSVRALLSPSYPILELNLYDSGLSAEALIAISEYLAANIYIQKLDLAYNSDAFMNTTACTIFGKAVSANANIESLNLAGNSALGSKECLTPLLDAIKGNKSLIQLSLAGIGMGNDGVELICLKLFNHVPIYSLDLQNNMITNEGICKLIDLLPESVVSLDLSYNSISDASVIISISSQLIVSRSLRKLNLSHSIELYELDSETLEYFCESLTTNESLNELILEGVKLGINAEDFCETIQRAIAERRLSLTYKISAVKCILQHESSRSSILIVPSETSRVKLISNVPSVTPPIPRFKRGSLNQTHRKETELIDSCSSVTEREYNFESFS